MNEGFNKSEVISQACGRSTKQSVYITKFLHLSLMVPVPTISEFFTRRRKTKMKTPVADVTLHICNDHSEIQDQYTKKPMEYIL